jgi:hypothetical protein
MAWPVNPRLAKTLTVLRDQIDAAHPNRSKLSDGAIGDKAHQALGKDSDHNAWFNDSKGVSIVTAIDITHDPDNGVDIVKIADDIKDHPTVKYLIRNGEIYVNGSWRPYTGKNAHKLHLHVSAKTTNYDDTDPWPVGGSMQDTATYVNEGDAINLVPVFTGHEATEDDKKYVKGGNDGKQPRRTWGASSGQLGWVYEFIQRPDFKGAAYAAKLEAKNAALENEVVTLKTQINELEEVVASDPLRQHLIAALKELGVKQ